MLAKLSTGDESDCMKQQSEYENQEILKHDVWLYVPAVLKFWYDWIGWVFGTGFIALAGIYGKVLPPSSAPWLIAFAFLIAPFSAWRVEKNGKLAAQDQLRMDKIAAQEKLNITVQKLEAEKAELIEELKEIEAKHQQASDTTYKTVLKAYLEYPTSPDNSLHRLIKSGAVDFATEYELNKLCTEIWDRTKLHPFNSFPTIPDGHRLEALNWIRDRQINPNDNRELWAFLVEFNKHLGLL